MPEFGLYDKEESDKSKIIVLFLLANIGGFIEDNVPKDAEVILIFLGTSLTES